MRSPLLIFLSVQNSLSRFVSRTSLSPTLTVWEPARGILTITKSPHRLRDAFDWRELRRPRAVADRAFHRHVFELFAGAHAAEQQPAAPHAAAADERDGEGQARAEAPRQDVDVFRGRDAA